VGRPRGRPGSEGTLAKRIEPDISADPRLNRLLAALGPADYEAFIADATVVSLRLNNRLFRQDEHVNAVFFPLTCMVSVLAGPADGDLTEAATIGREGVAGSESVILNQPAIGLHVLQLPGVAVRMEGEAFRKQLSGLPVLKNLMDRHWYAMTRQTLLGAACNRLHRIEKRCARWLLMTHDRAGTESFPLTQGFLANMLAVRRATVNSATSSLKKAGLIRYVRGQLTVVDRGGLEAASCDCYRAIRRAYAAVDIPF
jgi:CRP-like cAMP-binding protein